MAQKEKLDVLQGKLDQIFDGLDDFYSQAILDELIKRIDTTINDFNKDFKSVIGSLSKTPAKKKTPVKRTRAVKKTSTAVKAKSTRSKAKTLK